MTLGALMKGVNTIGLDPPPMSPFYGYSFITLEETIKKFKEPNYNSINHKTPQPTSNRYQYSKPEPRSCSLITKINAIIDEQLSKANGLDLESFIDTC